MSMRRRFARNVTATALAVGIYVTAAPLATAQPQTAPEPTQESADRAIADGYAAKQVLCTPDTPPAFSSVSWYPPGFIYAVGGRGMINDRNPSLGGEFTAAWTGDRWNVEYLYC